VQTAPKISNTKGVSAVIIEYYATEQEDDKLFKLIQKFDIHIKEAFNPEDYYYVLETDDDRIVSIMTLLNIEMFIAGEKIVGGSASL
jgi:arsenate reductase-like glutaredoxin family protein